MAKRQDLQLESGVIAKQGRQRSKECRQNIEYWITKEGKILTSIISGGWSLREGQYVPKEKILVNADLYSPPAQGAPAPAPNPNMRTLQRNIQRLKLDVAQHVPIHGQPGPGDQFAQIMGRQTN